MARGTYDNPIWVRRRRSSGSGGEALFVLAIALAPFAPMYLLICKAFFLGTQRLFAITNFRNPGNENLAAFAPLFGYVLCIGFTFYLFMLLERWASGLTAIYYVTFWGVLVFYGLYRYFFHVGDDQNLAFEAAGWMLAEWNSLPKAISR